MEAELVTMEGFEVVHLQSREVNAMKLEVDALFVSRKEVHKDVLGVPQRFAIPRGFLSNKPRA